MLLEPVSIYGGYIVEGSDYTFEWYDPDGTQVSSESSILVNSESASEYQLVVYDDCQDQQTITNFSVDVISYPNVDATFPPYYACDDDIVVVDKNIEPKNGDIGAFMINDTEATVKYLDTVSGKKYLIPANKNYENFEVNENTQPIGKVVSLFRDI